MENSPGTPKMVSRIVVAPAGDVHASPHPGSYISPLYQQALALHQQNRFCEAESLFSRMFYSRMLDAETREWFSLPEKYLIPASAAKPDFAASRWGGNDTLFVV